MQHCGNEKKRKGWSTWLFDEPQAQPSHLWAFQTRTTSGAVISLKKNKPANMRFFLTPLSLWWTKHQPYCPNIYGFCCCYISRQLTNHQHHSHGAFDSLKTTLPLAVVVGFFSFFLNNKHAIACSYETNYEVCTEVGAGWNLLLNNSWLLTFFVGRYELNKRQQDNRNNNNALKNEHSFDHYI